LRQRAIDKAEDEADRLSDRIAGGDAAVNESANEARFHCKAADEALEDHRATVDNSEGNARRETARA
jgi:hypothetical protein